MRQIVYAFIDSQNLNLGVQNDVRDRKGYYHDGWKLDFRKFKRFLDDKYRVDEAYLFIGYKPGNEKLYQFLDDVGYLLIAKPTSVYTDASGRQLTKGNVDTDIVLHAAARQFTGFDKAVIVSGDGDFLSLYEYLIENDKLLKIVIPNKYRYSSLLDKHQKYLHFLNADKAKLELKPKK